jgi:hypothetical protein
MFDLVRDAASNARVIDFTQAKGAKSPRYPMRYPGEIS